MDVRLAAFRDATASLTYLANLDIEKLREKLADDRLMDALENGRAQKFEYTMELCWKTLKTYLKSQEGIDEASPKRIIKAYYLADQLTEDDYLLLLDALEDRNRLSHIYDENTFRGILARIPTYAALFSRVCNQMAQADNSP